MRVIGNPNELPGGALIPDGEYGITKPRSCAVIPQRTTDPEGFIETGNDCGCGKPVIISFAAVREMARIAGLNDEGPAADLEELEALRVAFDALAESKGVTV